MGCDFGVLGVSARSLAALVFYRSALAISFFFEEIRLVIDRGHVVFDAIMDIIAQTFYIGLSCNMSEGCSGISKNIILMFHTVFRLIFLSHDKNYVADFFALQPPKGMWVYRRSAMM